jgi:flagellin
MRINTNIMAFNAYRNLDATNNMLAKSLEKLSSGYRINRAADDASGLVISQNLAKQVSGLTQATQNAQDGISVVQTAEGALTQVNSMLQRMHDLIVQAANTASSDATARSAAQNEISQLRSEIDRIGQTTSFGNQNLLDGSFGAQHATIADTVQTSASGRLNLTSLAFSLHLDANRTAGQRFNVSVALTGALHFSSAASFQTALQTKIHAAIVANTSSPRFTAGVTVSVSNLGIGAWQVSFTHNGNAVNTGIAITGTTTNGATGGILNTASSTLTTLGGGVFQVGANVTAADQISVTIDDVRVVNGTNSTYTALSTIDVTNPANNSAAATVVDNAINAVSSLRGSLGAYQNRFESTIANLQVTTENLSASESRIRDTDMASEMVNFTRDQIMLQAGTAMLAQANAAPQTILRLLQ